MMRKRIPLLLTSTAVFLFAFAALAQQPAPTGQPAQQHAAAADQKAASRQTPVFKVKTRLVVVDVVARNSKGEVITGLKPEDFKLSEDGKPQRISVFSFQHPEANVKPLRAPVLPPGTFNNLPQYKPNGALNVLLLDGLNTSSPHQAYAREEMIKLLEKLPANEPMAVYLLGTRLRLIQDFTTDPELLKKAALSIKSKPSHLLNNPAGTSPQASPMGSAAADLIASVPGLANQLSEFAAEENLGRTDFRVAYTLSALNSLARTLAGYPGRKNLIWLSETFPFDIVLNAISPRSDQLQRHYGDDVAMTGSLLSDAQVAVYPVDVRGLSNNTVYDIANDPNPMAGMNTGGGAMRRSMAADSDINMATRTTMEDMAAKTGGRAFYNRNNLDEAVLESVKDGSTYYTLGYYPDNKQWNSQFRDIRVKVNRPGAKLHYRAGYFAIDREAVAQANPAKLDQELDQAMTLDWPIATGLPFEARVLPPSAQTQNRVVIRYAIDPKALNFEPDDKGLERVNLLCAVRAYSVKDLNKPLKSEGNRLAGSLRPEAFTKVMSGFFPCQEQVDLPPGKYVLRLGVRDNSTGLIGTANATLEVAGTVGALSGQSEKKP
ncbi:MAG: VWA domain-containing protein [Actinomycetota bacterium]